MGAFELPLLIIVWFVAICLIAPVILAVLILTVGAVCSLWFKFTDSNSTVDEVKANPNAYSDTKDKHKDKFSDIDLENARLAAIYKRKVIAYIKSKYADKYPTVENFTVLYKAFSNVLILKDKDGKVLGKEEIGLTDLWELREAALREYDQEYNYLTN